MTIRGGAHRAGVAVGVLALVAGACGGGTTTVESGQERERGGTGTASPAGLATDQPCTKTVSLDAGIRDVEYRLDDLEATVLTREELGVADPGWERDSLAGGYMDNQEWVELENPVGCEDLIATERITGYSGAFVKWEPGGGWLQVMSQVHLFFSNEGATQFVEKVPEAMRAIVEERGAAIEVTPIETLGAPATRIEITSETDHWRWVWFAEGPMAGWVQAGEVESRAATPEAETLAEQLRRSIRDTQAEVADRSAEPFGAARFLSAPLPLAEWGPRYQELEWDWFFGGCLDAEERASYTDDEEARQEALEEAQRFGRRAECGSMYVPADGATSEVSRIMTWVRIYDSEAGARDAFAAGKDGVPDGELTEVHSLGDAAYGSRGVSEPGEGEDTETSHNSRVVFRAGRVIGVVGLNETTGRDAGDELVALAEKLEERFAELFE